MLFLWHVENTRASKGASHPLGAFIHIPDSRANLHLHANTGACLVLQLQVVELSRDTALILHPVNVH